MIHAGVVLEKNINVVIIRIRKFGTTFASWLLLKNVIIQTKNFTSIIFNPSVNACRRLDSYFEAPNQIKVSPIDRGSMIRIPAGNEKSARIEIRAVAPDANPYLVLYTMLRTGLEGKKLKEVKSRKNRLRLFYISKH